MSINVNTVSETYAAQSAYSKTKGSDTSKEKVDEKKSTGFSDVAAVYEPSAAAKGEVKDTVKEKVKDKTDKGDRTAIVEALKAENQKQIDSMKKMVMDMISGQGKTLGQADSIWSFLASGDFTVTEAAKKQAEEAIGEDGYWGVEQTSQRIVDFAKALAGDDVSKADKLLNAFKKGFNEATKAWGKELPDISKRTYEAVEKKFQAWKDEAKTTANPVADGTSPVIE